MLVKKIQETFPEFICSQITNVKLLYEGLHNFSFLGFYKKEKVQIRIIKLNWVSHDDEIKFISNLKNFLFVDSKGNYIKKWIEGKEWSRKENSNKYWHNLCLSINNFHKLNLENTINSFDWNSTKINDFQYLELISKYKDMPLVVSHNDLRPKNVIVDIANQVHLIDFEWIRMNSPYFDYACLYLYFNISKNFIVKYFNINKNILKDYIYLVQKFNINWEKNNY